MKGSHWSKLRLRRLARRDAENDRRGYATNSPAHSVEQFVREYGNQRERLISKWRTRQMLPIYRKLKNSYETFLEDKRALAQLPATTERIRCEEELAQNQAEREHLEPIERQVNNLQNVGYTLVEINQKLKDNGEARNDLLTRRQLLLQREKTEQAPILQRLEKDRRNWKRLDRRWQGRESRFADSLEGLRAAYTEACDYYCRCYKRYRSRIPELKSFEVMCRNEGVETAKVKTVLADELASIEAWRKDLVSHGNT